MAGFPSFRVHLVGYQATGRRGKERLCGLAVCRGAALDREVLPGTVHVASALSGGPTPTLQKRTETPEADSRQERAAAQVRKQEHC